MEILIIKGGKKLEGEITISGAKNAALPLMAATILWSGKHKLSNIPDVRDIRTMIRLLTTLGAAVTEGKNSYHIDTTNLCKEEAPYNLVKTMRASVLTLGPLLSRLGKAKVSLPGGCAIGARPIDLHIQGLEKMGAAITLSQGYVIAETDGLRGADISFDIPTVTGTENIMMAAVTARGKTRIENAAREPEVKDLAEALISMGANISGAGESMIEIEGTDELTPLSYSIIPDRIETGTFCAIAGVTNSNVLLKGCKPEHLESVIEKLREAGIDITVESSSLRVKGPSKLHSTNIKTMPYPWFPTDMQAQFMALMCVADGTSVIREKIFENRYMHVAELRRMGANIETEGNTATVRGVNTLNAAPVMATDLRASASLIVAAMAAEGETIIDRIYHLDRGYEKIDEKLVSLGGDVKRVSI